MGAEFPRLRRQPWEAEAACRGTASPSMFFPSKGADAMREIAAAKAVCAVCPVVAPCLEVAIGQSYNDDIGVLGGTSTSERRAIRRRRARESSSTKESAL